MMWRVIFQLEEELRERDLWLEADDWQDIYELAKALARIHPTLVGIRINRVD